MKIGSFQLTGGAAALLIVTGFLIWGISLAAGGNVAAIVALSVLAAIALVCIGAGIVAGVTAINAKRQQADFLANARENLAMMATMQRVQNMQTQNMMRQLPAGELLHREGWTTRIAIGLRWTIRR